MKTSLLFVSGAIAILLALLPVKRVKLAWSPVTGIDHYVLYWGQAPATYTLQLATTKTFATVSTKWPVAYFAATSVKASGAESNKSNEVKWSR